MNKTPVICFEGASAVGKTTLCQLLSESYNIVPEVNLLYKRDEKSSKYWYHEKQIERYQLCAASNKKSILDGDIFQPIWYNWIYQYPSGFLSKDEMHQFYERKINEKQLAFPDLYILFQIEETELRIRKENDATRTRSNFEKHLKYIAPQKRYFKFIQKHTDLEVKFISHLDLAETKDQVTALIEAIKKKKKDNSRIFKQITDWITMQTST